MRKVCTSCNKDKDESEFYRCTRRKDGRHSRCKLCYKPYHGRYYENNKELVIDRGRKSRVKYQELKLGRVCFDCGKKCGKDGPPICFEFDHLPEFTKTASVSTLIGSTNKLKLEIDKCDFLCVWCHRIRTNNRGALAQW